MKEWRFWLAEQRQTLMAIGIFVMSECIGPAAFPLQLGPLLENFGQVIRRLHLDRGRLGSLPASELGSRTCHEEKTGRSEPKQQQSGH